MNKPTEEMLTWLDSLGKIINLQADNPKDRNLYLAIRDRIEKYGDGGPKVTMSELLDVIEEAKEENNPRGYESHITFSSDKFASWLRSKGVPVGE